MGLVELVRNLSRYPGCAEGSATLMYQRSLPKQDPTKECIPTSGERVRTRTAACNQRIFVSGLEEELSYQKKIYMEIIQNKDSPHRATMIWVVMITQNQVQGRKQKSNNLYN